jgi:hypothetical protein
MWFPLEADPFYALVTYVAHNSEQWYPISIQDREKHAHSPTLKRIGLDHTIHAVPLDGNCFYSACAYFLRCSRRKKFEETRVRLDTLDMVCLHTVFLLMYIQQKIPIEFIFRWVRFVEHVRCTGLCCSCFLALHNAVPDLRKPRTHSKPTAIVSRRQSAPVSLRRDHLPG